ncbi:succinate receptor 1-like [Amphiura filiformis]|uniref:succinate receptor 1-like n=1 Tax=Amphiura filiformis TaxID=82378 RepID=UPI003B20CD3B
MADTPDDNTPCDKYFAINLTHPEAASAWIFSETDKIVNVIVIPIISSIGLLGNLAFLFSIFRLRSMQTSLNVFTRSLAVADAAYLIAVIYWALMDYQKTKIPNDAFGSWAECGVFSIVIHMSYFASVGFITLISVERYLAICDPLKHRAMKSKGRAHRLAAIVWIVALVIAAAYVPQFAFTKFCLIWPDSEEYGSFPTVFKACLPLNVYVAIYAMLIAIVSFILALLINGTIYVKIILALTRRSDKDVHLHQDKTAKLRNQVTRILVINGIIFFICQMPYRIANTDNLMDNLGSGYDLLSKKEYDTVHNIGISFFILNSCINPYLYIMGSRQYRNAMFDAFKITFCRRCTATKDKDPSASEAQSSTQTGNGATAINTVSGSSHAQKL